MITAEQQHNRDTLLHVMYDIIDRELEFHIHDICACPLHYLQEHTESTRYEIFEEYFVAEQFGLPESVCSDLFALDKADYTGSVEQVEHAPYHLERIIKAFEEHM